MRAVSGSSVEKFPKQASAVVETGTIGHVTAAAVSGDVAVRIVVNRGRDAARNKENVDLLVAAPERDNTEDTRANTRTTASN